MASVGLQSGNCLSPSETTKFSIWPTRRCRQKFAREVQAGKLHAAFGRISLLETQLAKATEDISSWQHKYEQVQQQVATEAVPTHVRCDREELVTRLSLEVPTLVDGIQGESTATNEQIAKRNMAAHCFGVKAMQIQGMNMATLNRVQRDPTLRRPRRCVRAAVRAHRCPPARRSAAEAVPTCWAMAGRSGRRCRTQLSRERCCYDQVKASAGGKAKEVATLTGAVWFKMTCCEEIDQETIKGEEKKLEQVEESFELDEHKSTDMGKEPAVFAGELIGQCDAEGDPQCAGDEAVGEVDAGGPPYTAKRRMCSGRSPQAERKGLEWRGAV